MNNYPMKLLRFILYFLVIVLISVFLNITYAEQIQTIPIPLVQPFIQTQPILPSQQLMPTTQQLREQPRPIEYPPIERFSEFEQYVSEQVLEITEFQLEILKKFEDITFQYTAKNLPQDKIAITVKVVKIVKKIERRERESEIKEFGIATTPIPSEITEFETATIPIIVDAGYLIGTPEAISNAFKILGMKSLLTISTDIRQFAYELFRKPPTTFAPVESVPVGPDYVFGPGDEIRITLWGKIEGQWNVVVDRDGNINLLKVGVLGVAGLTFKELKDTLYKELSKYYTGFEMNVSMGALRTIRIYVVGNAEKPGAYTISSLSTLVNALFEAGGPSKTGTMRNIQVKRKGETIVHFDMYDFLLNGDKTKDIRLMPEDVIFIPPVGPLAAIAGSVNNPAIYELKERTMISQLIEMAGGLNAIAFKGRIQIERIIDKSRQVVFESNLDEIGDKDITLQSGDVVKIFQIVRDRKVVRLSGAVQREGEYGVNPGMTVTVKDLISMAGGLKYYAYNKEAELMRVYVTDEGPQTEKILINLEKALAGDPESNISLKEDDYLFVRTIPEWEPYQAVNISGEVKFPGTYTIKKGERLSSLIERAGGYTDKAYLRGAMFTRERVRELQQKSLAEMVLKLEKELLAGGAVQISTALSREEIEAKRVELEQKQKFIESLKRLEVNGRISIKLVHLRLLKGSEYNVELEDGDSLHIPIKNSVVNVVGAVMSRGSFVYSDRLDYKGYIDMAGGYTRYADTGNVYALKVDGSAKKLSRGFLSWNAFKNIWEVTAFGEEVKELEPGDTIVVPEKLERIAWLREIKDITQILYQIAVTAGVALVLF